jgi:hypothetical protein
MDGPSGRSSFLDQASGSLFHCAAQKRQNRDQENAVHASEARIMGRLAVYWKPFQKQSLVASPGH